MANSDTAIRRRSSEDQEKRVSNAEPLCAAMQRQSTEVGHINQLILRPYQLEERYFSSLSMCGAGSPCRMASTVICFASLTSVRYSCAFFFALLSFSPFSRARLSSDSLPWTTALSEPTSWFLGAGDDGGRAGSVDSPLQNEAGKYAGQNK